MLLKKKYAFDDKFRIREFIGLDLEVIESTNKSHVGLNGKVIDETSNMIIISSNDKITKIPKETCIFKFKSKKTEVIIAGSSIVGKPEDRIKKFLKKRN